ncbi:hypothetical protein EYF80_056973 [Liparis tanakae]|uniref:Uncharacterized protein n=1 Tax=Liparis tanakae TaxID=230148 RepID=A0A4Z2EWB1_9TELE|nr:hypothetical protein EYF80_056973 [Liparis tanakae]
MYSGPGYREYNDGGIKTAGRHFVSVELSLSEAKRYVSRVIFRPSDWLFSLPINTGRVPRALTAEPGSSALTRLTRQTLRHCPLAAED